MSRTRRLLYAAGALGVTGLAAALGLRSLVYLPPDVAAVPVTCAPDAPALPSGAPIKVLVWNIQYSAGRSHHFFYDGGEAVHVSRDDVRSTLEAVAAVIREHNPDIVLLQEVDRGSDRTQRIDQHTELLKLTPYPCHAATPYHRVRYVPHPGHNHLGKVDMNLSVFSRYQLGTAERVQLALLDEPWWRKAFNLRRALLTVDAPIEGGGTLRLLNTHLSAFSKGDGTLGKQMAQLDAAATTAEQAGLPWVLAGDLNALAPGDDPQRLGADAAWYAEANTPVGLLFGRHHSVIPEPLYRSEPKRFYTYLPFGAAEPDRTLDYAFVGRKVAVTDFEVIQATDISDHLPIVFTITLGDP